jgi:hypothetical protein
MLKIVLSTLLSTAILFVWSGMAQMLPWGIPSTQNVIVQRTPLPARLQVPNVVQLSVDALITDQFDAQFLHKISTLTTDQTFSWIVTQPLNEDYRGYLLVEFGTQFIVALLLALLLYLTRQLAFGTRVAILLLVGGLAVAATYGQLMNWWRIPALYALGVSFNLVLSWGVAGLLSMQLILKREKEVSHAL